MNNTYIGIVNYCHAIPKKSLESTLKSGIYTFALSALFGKSISTSLFNGALASMASVVNALIKPLFGFAKGDCTKDFKWYEYAASRVIVLGVSQLLIHSLTGYRINLLASSIFMIGLDLLLRGFKDRPANLNTIYILM